MKPIDPRLLRYSRATRLFMVAVVGLGVVGAALVIAQAMLVAEVVVGAFQHGMTVGELGTPLLLLAAVAVPLLRSHAKCDASAALPPFPKRNRLRPFSYA